MATHAVTNQAPARTDIDGLVGSAGFQRDAELANVHPPALRTHDRWGHRVDDVEFHPAYHTILGAALRSGAHSQTGPRTRRRAG